MSATGNPSTPDDYAISSVEEARTAAEQFKNKYPNLGLSSQLTEAQLFAEGLAEAHVEEGVPRSEVDKILSSMTQDMRKLNKTDIKEDVEDQIQSLSSDNVLPLDQWLQAHIDKVVITKSTDDSVDPVVKWMFDDGTVVETTDEHFAWNYFAQRLNQANNMFMFTEPHNEYKDGADWKFNFMMPFLRRDFVEVRQFEETSRREAIEELQNTITASQAVDSPDAAYEASGVYVEGPDADYVYILSSDVDKVVGEFEETRRSIQSQLASDGVIKGDSSKVSRTKKLASGQVKRFWKLPISFAEPDIREELWRDDEDESEERENERGTAMSRGGDDE